MVKRWMCMESINRPAASINQNNRISQAASKRDGSTLNVIREEPDGVVYEAEIAAARGYPDEQIVGRGLDARVDLFVITYAVRAPMTMTPERRSEWIEKLSTITLSAQPREEP